MCLWVGVFKGTPLSRCRRSLHPALDVSCNLYLGGGGTETLPRKGKGQPWRVRMRAAVVQWRHQTVRGAIYFII